MDNTQSKHFICTGGCGGVSSNPNAVCQAEECANYHKTLKECDCTDGKHEKVLEKKREQ